MICADNISYAINERTLLKNIDLEIETGQHLVILGANGAGKSTLIKILAGDIANHLGEIQLNGQPIKHFSTKALACIRGVMPQEVHLSFPFLVKEVVDMGSAPHQNCRENINIREKCLKLFDALHLADRLYPTLSGGEKQRVQLARVFSQIWSRKTNPEPRYLFLDECISALDSAHQHQVFEAVNQMKSQNVGTLSIMHDLNLASQYADEIILLKNGKVLAKGSPENVLTEANLADAYQIDANIIPHPRTGRPLVISNGRISTQ